MRTIVRKNTNTLIFFFLAIWWKNTSYTLSSKVFFSIPYSFKTHSKRFYPTKNNKNIVLVISINNFELCKFWLCSIKTFIPLTKKSDWNMVTISIFAFENNSCITVKECFVKYLIAFLCVFLKKKLHHCWKNPLDLKYYIH